VAVGLLGFGGRAVIDFVNRPIVVLDPGHGADEWGATSADGLKERDSNLDMAKRVQAKLDRAGVDVRLTRSTDGRTDGLNTDGMSPATATFADLQARVARANAQNPQLFLSLHSNGFSDTTVHGVEAWYDDARPFSDANKHFAELLAAAVPEALQ